MMRNASYFRAPQLGGATPQETEIIAFGLCNDRLSKADGPRTRIEALYKTYQLWSLLVNDLSLPGNALPHDLKQQLVSIGLWAKVYSNRAVTGDLPVQPLIDVNCNMIEGLRAQPAPPAPDTAWAEPRLTA
jgi:flagellar biosynthesis regulator FlaF